MNYYRGTLEQFNAWETACRIAEGIPLDDSGKINFVNDEAAPDNQRTIRYAECISHPGDSNDVIWSVDSKYPCEVPITIDYAAAVSLGFIEDEDFVI